jgi:alpha-2-macroglobulin
LKITFLPFHRCFFVPFVIFVVNIYLTIATSTSVVKKLLPSLALLFLVSCSSAPALQEGDTFAFESVALEVDPSRQAFMPDLDGPLRALSATPYGVMPALSPDQLITVTFTRPMVALGDEAAVAMGTMTVLPRIEGRVYWTGSQTLVFEPLRPLAPATEYEVRVAGGLTALNGDRLGEEIRWTFETPRPAFEWTDPRSNESFADPKATIRLRFNQRIRGNGAERQVELRSGRTRHQVSVSTANGDSVLVIRPRTALAADTPYQLSILPGLRSAEGPLATTDSLRLNFRTYGPLRFAGVNQDRPWHEQHDTRINPSRSITLTFSTPVRFGDVRRSLRFTPAVEWPVGIEAQDANAGTSHTVRFALEPETNYTAVVANLRDQFGQLLPEGRTTFRTRALEPSIGMPQGMLVIEAKQQAMLPLHATNVESVRAGAVKMRADQVIPALRSYDRMRYYGETDQQGDRAVTPGRSIQLRLARNRPGVVPLRLDTLLTNGVGLVGLVVEAEGIGREAEPRQMRALVQVTNLAVTAKFSAHNNLIVVTDLATAKPVSGAGVTIRGEDNRVRWTGRTDRSGRVTTPGWARLNMARPSEWESPTQYVFVEHNGELVFTTSRHNDGIEAWRFDIQYSWWPEEETFGGSVFSDRGLYRAGETVHMKGILRRRTDGDWRPVTDSVRVFIRSPREQNVFEGRFKPGDLGTISFDWNAPETADQGHYFIRIALASDTAAAAREPWRRGDVAQGNFRVDSFRRSTFAVSARPGSDSYTGGDFFEGRISGRYLFGAAMGGQPVRYDVFSRPTTFEPDGFPGFRFGTFEYDNDVYRMIARGEEVLDAEGTLGVRAPMAGNRNGTPLMLTFSATVTDPARQEGSGRAEVILHPGQFYVGMKPKTTFLDLTRDARMTVDVATIDPAGVPLGGQRVSVQLVRRQWNSVREQGVDGRLRWRSELAEEVLGTQQVRTEPGRAIRVHMPVGEGGSYVIRATGRDVRGNTVRTDAHFYASGSGYSAWQRTDDDHIELVPERTNYKPGETARLMVQSPYEEATALITVERDGIISSRVETLRGSAPMIEVPLTEEHLPNVFVSVMLLSGRVAPPGATHDTGAPSFKIGYASLRVDPGARRLQVEVQPDRSTYGPGDEVVVQLQVRDAGGRGVPSELTFSAADAGVLNLIGYALPNPFDAFYGPRSLGVLTSELRANLVKQRDYGQKEEDIGGGGGDSRDSRIRRDFRPQAHWAPAIRTDRNGRATVRFRLPESMTTFRLMATAVAAGNRFGSGRTDITLTQPLVVQPAMPRFVRPEDRFEAGVLVTNLTGSSGEAAVTVRARGVTIEGGTTQRVMLEEGQTKEVRFRWRATASGTATLNFEAALGRERDAFEMTLPVNLPATKLVAGTFAVTDDAASEGIAIPEGVIPSLGRFDVRLSSTALVGLEGAARYLFDYPYGCLEQTTSRIRPLLAGDELIRTFDLRPLGGDHRKVVEAWLAKLNDFWVGDGFALWAGSQHASPYLTAYVVLAMTEARDAGYVTPDDLYRTAAARLADQVRNRSQRPSYFDEPVWDDTRAFMLYVLARSGQVIENEIAALAQEYAKEGSRRSLEGTAHLLRTVTLTNRTSLNRFRAPLEQRLRERIRVEATTAYAEAPTSDSYGWIFASDTRATAYTLAALVGTGTSDDTRTLGLRMVRYLMASRQGPAWASTQDNAVVIEALAAYYRAFEAAVPDFRAEVRLAGQSILTESFAGRSTTVRTAGRAMADLPVGGGRLPVEITKTGRGSLYYALSMEAYSTAPQQAANHGLAVERRLQRLDASGKPVGASQVVGGGVITLEPGQLVQVTLRIQTPTDRHYVVIDDALPAGLEAINMAFETSARANEYGEYDYERWWGSFNHREFRDDRVLLFGDFMTRGVHTYTYMARATTAGTFVHPPARAELMYQPEVNGRTATGTLQVGRTEVARR